MKKFDYFEMPQFDNGQKAEHTVYSDRLVQWDYKKHNDLCQKHFGNQGQYWSGRDSSKIEAFLSEYIGKDIILCRIEELENASNGYPYWRFDYKSR